MLVEKIIKFGDSISTNDIFSNIFHQILYFPWKEIFSEKKYN
jgi:hypothetical protein